MWPFLFILCLMFHRKLYLILATLLINAGIVNSQNLLSLSSNIGINKTNYVSLHSLSLELKSLSVVSLRPGLEYEYRFLDRTIYDKDFVSNTEVYIPVTFGVRPMPKLSINTTFGLPITDNATSDLYFRFGFDYLVNKHFQLGGNVKYNFEFDLYPRYSLSASYLINNYYKSSQRYAERLKKRYDAKNGSGSFERELEASLDKKDYKLFLGLSLNANSFILLSTLNTSATLGIQKSGSRGAFYQLKLINSQFIFLDVYSFSLYRYVGPGIFIGEHRTREKFQFYHGGDFAMLYNTNPGISSIRKYPVVGYKLGIATTDFGTIKRVRLDCNATLNTLGPGVGLDLAYLLK